MIKSNTLNWDTRPADKDQIEDVKPTMTSSVGTTNMDDSDSQPSPVLVVKFEIITSLMHL